MITSADDVLSYIDDVYDTWCESPEMYSRNATELESVFLTLEQLRHFIVYGDRVGIPGLDYIKYLRDRYGTLNAITLRPVEPPSPPPVPSEDEKQEMSQFAALWREFMAWRKRSAKS